jgi:hypothetical protein
LRGLGVVVVVVVAFPGGALAFSFVRPPRIPRGRLSGASLGSVPHFL